VAASPQLAAVASTAVMDVGCGIVMPLRIACALAAFWAAERAMDMYLRLTTYHGAWQASARNADSPFQLALGTNSVPGAKLYDA
jgi:hypothetical protein